MTSKQKQLILGLDISTSCTGIVVMDGDNHVVHITSFKPKGNTLVEKANSLRDFLCNMHVELGSPELRSIYIEQNLQKFRRGFSSAQVINTLARFNGMISYIVFDNFGVQPEYINVNEGRKALGIKIPRGSDTKELIFGWCQQKYPKIEWPTKKLKSGPRKGLVIFDPCCYDMSDALITATAGLKLNEESRSR